MSSTQISKLPERTKLWLSQKERGNTTAYYFFFLFYTNILMVRSRPIQREKMASSTGACVSWQGKFNRNTWANSDGFFQLCQCVKYNGTYSVLRQKVTWDWGCGGGPKNSLVFSPLPALQMYIIWFFMFTYVASTFIYVAVLFMFTYVAALFTFTYVASTFHLFMWQHFSRLLTWHALFIYLCGSTFHIYLCGKNFSHLLMWPECFMFTYVAELLTSIYVMSYDNLPKFHHFVYPHVEHLVFLAYSTLFEALLGRTRAGSNKSLAGNKLTVSVWKGIF